jgi:hypothetical protein
MVHELQAICSYISFEQRWPGCRVSPATRSGRWQPTASTAETGSKLKKLSLAWLLGCTRAPRTSGKDMSVMRSMEERAEVSGEIQCRVQRDGSWAAKPSARGP